MLARLFQSWGGVGSAVTPALLLLIALGIAVQYVPRIPEFATVEPS